MIARVTWLLVIARALHQARRPLFNPEITESDPVRKHLRDIGKKPTRLSGIVSRTLNMHSEDGVSADKSRREPYAFGKDELGRWFLNEEGRKSLDLSDY